jgi:hypothetical protein
MYELRALRLKAGPSFTIECIARWLAMTIEAVIAMENTPLDELTIGVVASYLDVFALDIEVNATWLARSIMLQRLAPDGSLTICSTWSLGKDARILEHGREVLQGVLDENEPPSEPGEETMG